MGVLVYVLMRCSGYKLLYRVMFFFLIWTVMFYQGRCLGLALGLVSVASLHVLYSVCFCSSFGIQDASICTFFSVCLKTK